MSLKVGDWVRSYSAGVWQIYRILEYKCRNPVTELEQDKTTIFSKRFVSNAFKRSFKEECCDPSFVVKLNLDEMNELRLFMSQNAKLYEQFQKYEPKSIDSVYNARIGIPQSYDPTAIAKELAGSGPLRDIDIGHHLSSRGFDTKAMPFWTVQFVSKNFSITNGYLVFEFSRILEQ